MGRGEEHWLRVLRYLQGGGSIAPYQPEVAVLVAERQYERLRLFLDVLVAARLYSALGMFIEGWPQEALLESLLRPARPQGQHRTVLHQLVWVAPEQALQLLRSLPALAENPTVQYPDCRMLVDTVRHTRRRYVVPLLRELYRIHRRLCDTRDARGRTATHRAVLDGDWEGACALFVLNPLFAIVPDDQDVTPLATAVDRGMFDFVRRVLEYREGKLFSMRLFGYARRRDMVALLLQHMPEPWRLSTMERLAAAATVPRSAPEWAQLAGRSQLPREGWNHDAASSPPPPPPLTPRQVVATRARLPPLPVPAPATTAPTTSTIILSDQSSSDSGEDWDGGEGAAAAQPRPQQRWSAGAGAAAVPPLALHRALSWQQQQHHATSSANGPSAAGSERGDRGALTDRGPTHRRLTLQRWRRRPRSVSTAEPAVTGAAADQRR